jgi:hypothetical protein
VARGTGRTAQYSHDSVSLAKDSTIDACYCDSSDVFYAAGGARILSQGDVLNICLTFPSDTEFSRVSKLRLTQGAGFKFESITNGVENVGALVINPGGQIIVVQVTMMSAFYLTQSVPEPVNATGQVIIKLAGEAQERHRECGSIWHRKLY